MGLYGMMRTSISGMAAQADRLGAVSDNIANSSTTGYKRASIEFSSLIPASSVSRYASGSVQTDVRYAVSEQGSLSYTTSPTDIAINGSGFFVVAGQSDETFLTRAGSFVLDGEGYLINAGGFKLMGFDLSSGDAGAVANGTAGVEAINVGSLALQANPSSTGSLYVNFPADAGAVAAANLPSANVAGTQYTAKSSLAAYASLGREVTLDIFATKVADETWEVSVFDAADAATGGGFPFASGPLATTTYSFDATTGALASGSATSISIPIPNGETLVLDMSQSSQLATDYLVREAAVVNGNAASAVDRVEISKNGEMFAVFESGDRVATHRIPVANVASPDNLRPFAGNVFAVSADSGNVQLGQAGQNGLGGVVANAVEQSTVDIANELTQMIETQRNYTANSKVFQTGAELTEVLVNLVR